MSLPAPTVSGIDVNAERLKDVERRRAAPVPNIAAAAKDAIVVSNAVTQMTEAQKAREQAQWFQKEYVDKGWEGYEKLWQESGAPPAADPRIVRQSIGDSPVAAFKYLGDLEAQKAAKAATETYNKTLTGDDAAAAAAGVKPEKIYEEKNKREAVNTKAETSKENTRVRAAATRTAAGIRQALSGAKDASVVAAIERENARKDDIEAEIDANIAAEAAGDMTAGALRRANDKLIRDLSAIDARISGYIVKVGDVSKVPESIRKPGEAEKKDPLKLF